jgi:hypothetical protein
MDKSEDHEKRWGTSNPAHNCKFAISASSALNGKLVVELISVDVYAYVFLQPNNFDNNGKTKGIIENSKVYTKM